MPDHRLFAGKPSIDLFGRLRVSQPQTLYDAKQIHDNLPLLWDEAKFGTGDTTYSAIRASSALTTAASGDAVIRQTFSRFNYQPGKSQLALMTFLAPKQANVRSRVGLFETSNDADSVPQNGVYLEVDGDTVTWNIARNGVVTETVAQANWSETKLESLDLSDAQIVYIAFEWLGVGTVQVGFVIDGSFVPCHNFQHANNGFSSVYMSTPNLPLCYSIYQSGDGSGSMEAICSTVISEGGSDVTGVSRCVDMGSTAVTAAAIDTTYALIGIRLKSSYSGAIVAPQFVNAIATSANDSFLMKLILNPIVAGTFTYSDVANSAVQRAIGVQSNTVTGGTVLWSRYASASSRESNVSSVSLPRIGKAIDGTLDQLVVAVQPAVVNVDMLASIGWVEQS